MARMWFPDAGAGADEEGLALVAKQINDLARGGFGGVEIAFLSDSTNYNNRDARTIGLDYEKDMVAKFGPDPRNDNFAGKVDSEGARRRMADWQLLYQTMLDSIGPLKGYKPSAGDAPAVGDYVLTGLDIAGAAAALDIPEGDNSSSGDGIRNLVAAVNVKGGKMLSMESTTFFASMNSTWAAVIKELNRDFSHGVNRSTQHGSAFARTFNRFNSEWPGWNFWDFSSWNARQIHWDDVDTFSGYVAGNQALMQNGKPSVDIAVLLGTVTPSACREGILCRLFWIRDIHTTCSARPCWLSTVQKFRTACCAPPARLTRRLS